MKDDIYSLFKQASDIERGYIVEQAILDGWLKYDDNKEIHDFLKEAVFQIDHACANIFAMRGAILEEAIKQGDLSFDKDNDKQMLERTW